MAERFDVSAKSRFSDKTDKVLFPSCASQKRVSVRTDSRCPREVSLKFHDRPEWHGKTLFIDGLDEMRTGTVDGAHAARWDLHEALRARTTLAFASPAVMPTGSARMTAPISRRFRVPAASR